MDSRGKRSAAAPDDGGVAAAGGDRAGSINSVINAWSSTIGGPLNRDTAGGAGGHFGAGVHVHADIVIGACGKRLVRFAEKLHVAAAGTNGCTIVGCRVEVIRP